MNELHLFLIKIWFILLSLTIVLYVILNGFDLGIGSLTLLQKKPALRSQMFIPLTGISDANATWLVLTACVLFGAFPLGYAMVLHAMYIPILLLLSGLILRRVGLKHHTQLTKPKLWLALFGGGSLLASLAQGLVLGGILDGLSATPANGNAFIFNWLTPFSILTSIGVALGYCLLGATFLLRHSSGQLTGYAKRWALASASGMLISLLIIFSWLFMLYPQMEQHWLKPAPLIILAALLAAIIFASIALFHTLRNLSQNQNNWRNSPFFWSQVIFILTFIGLAMSLYPSLIPGHLSLQAAAASDQTLIFMIFGIGMLFPILLIYNGYQYIILKKPHNAEKIPLSKTTDANTNRL